MSSCVKPRPRASGMRDCRARIPLMYLARKLCEFPAVTKVDGLPPATSRSATGAQARKLVISYRAVRHSIRQGLIRSASLNYLDARTRSAT
eukprot:8780654-Pyramimonas_sp.AAC.1